MYADQKQGYKTNFFITANKKKTIYKKEDGEEYAEDN